MLRRLFGALLAVAVVIGGGASAATAMAAHGSSCLTTSAHGDPSPAGHHQQTAPAGHDHEGHDHGSEPTGSAASLCPFTLCMIAATLSSVEATAPVQHRLGPGESLPEILLAGRSPPPRLRPPRPLS